MLSNLTMKDAATDRVLRDDCLICLPVYLVISKYRLLHVRKNSPMLKSDFVLPPRKVHPVCGQP